MSKDTIYRDAAIKTAIEWYDTHFRDGESIAGLATGLKNLPSAQPEIIMCKDCKNWDTTWQNDWAKNYHYCPLIDGTRNGDFYCADGERRTDDER